MDKLTDACDNCYWSVPAGVDDIECRGSTPTVNLESNTLKGYWPTVPKTEWCRHHSRGPINIKIS